MKKLLLSLCVFFFVFRAYTVPFPSLEPSFVPHDLFTPNGIPTVFSADEIIQFSLLFSECEPESTAYKQAVTSFEVLRKKILDPQIMSLAEEDRGRAVLKLLYMDTLKHYEAGQTKIDVALQTGNYNCVSSALRYMAAAKTAGLDVRGQKTPDHAFCSVYISGKRIDVETTNPYGFNPGSREAIEHENVIKGYYVVPKTYYSNRREVRDALFTGLIAGNLCSDYINKDDYNKALPLGTARYLAVINDNSQAAADVRKEFDILAANFINLVVDNAETFSERLEWYYSFIDRWGMTTFLQNNMDNAVNNLLVLCYEEKNYELAEKGWLKYKSYVSPKRVSTMEEMLVDIFIAASTQGFSLEEQLCFPSAG